MTLSKAMPPARRLLPCAAGALMLAAGLAGCTITSNTSDSLDYRSKAAKTQPLDVPPDLTQLSREGRFVPQSGVVVSANAMRTGGPAGASATAVAARPVAPSAQADLRVERQGNTRWLSTSLPPEQLFPVLRSFWTDLGFTLTTDNPDLGLLQTDWAENRAKLPNDIIRNTLGKVFDGLFSTGERDMFRTRVERTATGSEVFISHRGMVEVYIAESKDITRWQPRPADPQLEAEFLSRLMLRLGTRDEPTARAAVAQAPEVPTRARTVAGEGPAVMELDEPFDRAWRQVGLALDRTGFTVEDRDRSAGLYFVRYVDPKLAGQDEPGFWSRLFGTDDKNRGVQRLRVAVKTSADKTRVSVQDSAGKADDGEAARSIVARLVDALR